MGRNKGICAEMLVGIIGSNLLDNADGLSNIKLEDSIVGRTYKFNNGADNTRFQRQV